MLPSVSAICKPVRPTLFLRQRWKECVLASTKGLTLIELLIVVAILAILTAVVMPVLGEYVNQARTRRATLEIRQLEKDILSFNSETGEFPETLLELGSRLRDPWGRPYRYQLLAGKSLSGKDKVQPRKNRFLHPLNTDFDLYSVGPDGVSQLALTAKSSHDDIIRANNGGYIGEAKLY